MPDLLTIACDSPRDWVNAGQALHRILLTSAAYGVAAALHSQPLELAWLRKPIRDQVSDGSYPQLIIAFAADVIDPTSRSGWAVQVLGRSVMPRRQPGPGTGCGRPAAGQVVNIEPESITGHAVHPCPLIDALRPAGPAFLQLESPRG